MGFAIPAVNHVGIREQTEQALRRLWFGGREIWWHTYWDLQVSGLANLPADGPMLLCSNHTSHLDAPAILAALPGKIALQTATAAARDVFGARLKRTLSRITTNALCVERRGDFAGGLRLLENVLRQGRPLILFPEGRRSQDGGLLDFKCGAAMLAIRTGAPLIPIHITGLHESMPRGQHLPLPADVSVRFGRAIDPQSFQAAIERGEIERREAYERLTEELRSAINDLGNTSADECHSEPSPLYSGERAG
ncbi:MAG TPA: lysophospholipid acyltransferase family protein [Humisphaera sp.]|nr:lysophospholipid acyltransferase family protein [Humisphaera sp.]